MVSERKGRHPRRPSALRPAVVVGAGVSGCACAATLAARGLEVTLVNSALDTVGLPAFGPDVVPGAGGRAEIAEVLTALPEVLRDVWVGAMVAPLGAPFVCVDRRMISIETKRALEAMPGLELRQGLVSDLRIVAAGQDSVGERQGLPSAGAETVFGEVVEGRTVVIAVGLSLGGCVAVGEHVLGGGRYGEATADGLLAALEGLGARFREVCVEVGPRFSGDGAWRQVTGGSGETASARWEVGGRGGTGIAVPLRREPLGDGRGGQWSAEYPPAPYWTDGLWAEEAVVATGKDGLVRPVMSPDGVATGEVHLAGEGEWSEVLGGAERGRRRRMGPAMASRPLQRVRGLVVTNVSQSGRLVVEGGPAKAIWVTGRASGATGYLESLLSGVRTGIDVAAAVRAWG